MNVTDLFERAGGTLYGDSHTPYDQSSESPEGKLKLRTVSAIRFDLEAEAHPSIFKIKARMVLFLNHQMETKSNI